MSQIYGASDRNGVCAVRGESSWLAAAVAVAGILSARPPTPATQLSRPVTPVVDDRLLRD